MVKYFERFRIKYGMTQDTNSHPNPLSTERGNRANPPRMRGKTAKAVRGSCAFTLVELIVVIVILAILGTISFISLQNYSSSARDTKRINDVKSLISKITIENVKGVDLSRLIIPNGERYTYTGTTSYLSGDTIVVGTPDFGNLQENSGSFQDPSGGNYTMAYSVNTQRVAGMYTSETTGKNVCIGEIGLFDVLGENGCDSSGIPITPTYTITYNANGGSVSGRTPTTYNIASSTITPSGGSATKTNSTFIGWSPTNIPTNSTGDKIFTAQWSACTECAGNTGVNCSLSVVNNVCTYTTNCQLGYGNLTNNGAYNASCTATGIYLCADNYRAAPGNANNIYTWGPIGSSVCGNTNCSWNSANSATSPNYGRGFNISSYPAMTACANLGAGWRLPTKDELVSLSSASCVRSTFFDLNSSFVLHSSKWWSSTEYSTNDAYFVDMDDGYSYNDVKTSQNRYVVCIYN